MQIKANNLPRERPAEPRFPEDDPVPYMEEPVSEPSPVEEAPKKKRIETSKLIVWVCLVNGFLWVWCSYLLAWFGREQIAENLSQVAVTEIIGVVLVHCLKTVVENLSKNNNWPDRFGDDETGGAG